MKRIYKYKGNNPLARYYNELAEENKNKRVNNWRIMSERTGMPVQTLISVSRKSKTEVQKMLVETYFKIKDTIDVDMLKFNKKK